MPQLVALRGQMAAGKSTAIANLRKDERLSEWAVIHFAPIKAIFNNLGDVNRRKFGKQVLISSLKKIMRTSRNIIVDEMSAEALRRYLTPKIEKYDYDILVFEFEVDRDITHRRNIERCRKRGVKPRTKRWMYRDKEIREQIYDPNAIPVNTTKLNKKQTVDFIISRLHTKKVY